MKLAHTPSKMVLVTSNTCLLYFMFKSRLSALIDANNHHKATMKHLTYAIVLVLLAHASCIGTINLSYDGLSCEAGAVQPNTIAYYTQSSSSCSPMNCTKSGVASSYKVECASGPSDVNIYLRNTTLYYGETKVCP
jgi:hypothetical protein